MFKALTLAAALVVAAVLAAAAAAAPPTHTSADRAFSTRAAQSNRFEIDTATVAIAKGKSAQVKAFARMLKRDHTTSSTLLKKAFGQLGGSVQNAGESAAQLKLLRTLQQPGGANFDGRFRQIQIAAHEQAIALFTKAQTSTSAPMEQFAKQALPMLKKHLELAQALPRR